MPPNVRRRSQPKKKKEDTTLPSSSAGARRTRRKAEPLRYLIAGALVLGAIYTILTRRGQVSSTSASEDRGPATKRDVGAEKPFQITQEEIEGHGDFGDGRRTTAKPAFLDPASEALHWVNVNLGNGGPEPNLSGGMIPAVAPPFGMTRWSPQTRQNYVSMCPYNQTDTVLHGFIGTHQPAIWMGESGPAQISAGLGTIRTKFEDRGLPFDKADEYASVNYYRNVLDAGSEGKIEAEMTATSRVGHIRYNFDARNGAKPYFVVQASRESILLSADNTESRDPNNVTYPLGGITIDVDRKEVYGWNDERQDRILVGDDLPAKSFKGYFVARFSHAFDSIGVSTRDSDRPGATSGEGEVLAGYVTFSSGTKAVEVRIGVSFISIEQARRNIDLEIRDGRSFIDTSRSTRQSWKDKLDTLSVTGATDHNKTVLYSSFAHTLVYPYEIHEATPNGPAYYSGYLDKVVPGESYSGYSIWDTYRAETAWLILNAPERVPGQINSMLQDYREGGWLPMWKNLVETNIMVGTHSDSIIAQAIKAGVQGVDWSSAWEAVKKNAYTPPDKDTELQFGDREEHTPQEVRAGLTEYSKLGYVANDLHTESGSRTLDYAYDDWAASIVAEHVGASEDAAFLKARAASYKNIWNQETGFMEARSANGNWAGEGEGWTEGDHWAYSLSVMHDVPGLIQLMGGKAEFIDFLDRHFEGDHNLHTNEPSHHIPYLYSFAGAAAKSQERIRQIGRDDYNHTADGLSGNEDCGQMSAWYLFSAMGFYPVDPASATYIIGAPFFDKIVLNLPNARKPLTITAQGASQGKKYVKSITIDGKPLSGIEISHDQLKGGADIVFEMADTPHPWGS